MPFICYRGCLHFLCWCEHHPRKHSIRPLTLLMITLTNTPKDKHFSMCTSLKKKKKKEKNWCLGDVARYDSQNIVATLSGHCFEWLQHCSSIATLCCAKNRSCKSSRVTSPLSPCKRNKKLKVARYSLSGSIPPKFERKLRRHKQRLGKINTTVVLDKDENLLWSGLQWDRSCHSNEMTPLPILLAAVFLGTGNCSSKIVYWSFYLR